MDAEGEQPGPVIEPDRVLATYQHVRKRWGLKNADTARMKAKRAGWPQLPKNSPSDVTRLVVPREQWDAVGDRTRGTNPPNEGEQPAGNGAGTSPLASPPIALPDIVALLARIEGQFAAELREARDLADRRAVELAELRERVGRAESEAALRREGETRERERADRAEAARRTAEEELAAWAAGGPLARAWRAFLSRRGRA